MNFKKYLITTSLLFIFISGPTLQAQIGPDPVNNRHFVVRAYPLRIVQNAFLNRRAQRNFPEFTGLSLEFAPTKLFSFEFEPGLAQLNTLNHILFETGWGINSIQSTNQWSPVGRITGRIYPFSNSLSNPKGAFEGFWLGFNFGYGNWKFDSLQLYFREHEPDPNSGMEYTTSYYRHSIGSISRSIFMGSIGGNFMLDKKDRLNFSLYLNAGSIRYAIKSDLETVVTAFGPPEIFINAHSTKSHFALQTGVAIGYAF